jgi:hypothetical protein
MSGLRLTARGEVVVNVLKILCIAVTLVSAWAILTMIGMS